MMLLQYFPGVERLTRRELEVTYQIAIECRSTKEASRVLGMSPRTAEIHRQRIFKKLDVPGIVGLVRKAMGV